MQHASSTTTRAKTLWQLQTLATALLCLVITITVATDRKLVRVLMPTRMERDEPRQP